MLRKGKLKMISSDKQLSRVLMISSYSYDGHHLRDLTHGFHLSGIEVGLISLSNAPKPKWLENGCGEDFSKPFAADLSLLRKIIWTVRLLRKFRPEVIQTHLFHGGIVGLIAGRITGVPVVHTRHHIDEHFQSGTPIHRFIDRIVAKRSDHVIVCSRAAKEWLIKMEGINPSQVTVINQGFDFSYLNPSNEEISESRKFLNLDSNKINIVCISRYSKVKGQNYLIDALEVLTKEIPNIFVTFIGPGDSTWLVELISELQLEKFVRVMASRSDVPACIAASDILVHTSLADSFSVLLIEAQAVGGLVIATDIAAAREQIIEGITGVIIPPRDSKSIAEAVRFLINNPGSAMSMRRNGPSHVREKFTWQRMVREEIECLTKYARDTQT